MAHVQGAGGVGRDKLKNNLRRVVLNDTAKIGLGKAAENKLRVNRVFESQVYKSRGCGTGSLKGLGKGRALA